MAALKQTCKNLAFTVDFDFVHITEATFAIESLSKKPRSWYSPGVVSVQEVVSTEYYAVFNLCCFCLLSKEQHSTALH